MQQELQILPLPNASNSSRTSSLLCRFSFAKISIFIKSDLIRIENPPVVQVTRRHKGRNKAPIKTKTYLTLVTGFMTEVIADVHQGTFKCESSTINTIGKKPAEMGSITHKRLLMRHLTAAGVKENPNYKRGGETFSLYTV